MGGSRKLRSPRMFVGSGAAREIRCKIGREGACRLRASLRGVTAQSSRESRRNRTWFSPAEAHRRLREGRRSEDGAEFIRVIDKAVARIRRLRAGTGIVDHRLQDRQLASGHVAKRRFAESALRGFRGSARWRSFLHAEHSSAAQRDAAMLGADRRGSFSEDLARGPPAIRACAREEGQGLGSWPQQRLICRRGTCRAALDRQPRACPKLGEGAVVPT